MKIEHFDQNERRSLCWEYGRTPMEPGDWVSLRSDPSSLGFIVGVSFAGVTVLWIKLGSSSNGSRYWR